MTTSPAPAARRRAATYRVQLHAGFTFDDAAAITGYLAALGISHLYCSPYLQAAPGSTHGYDVVDHGRLNTELGGAPAHGRLVESLAAAGLGQVLDIVPNHMALAGRANAWWWDVLENGPSSRYASYFDIDWDPPQRKLIATVLMPVLGDHYGRVLEAGELTVERQGGSFVVRYYDHEAPLSPRTLDDLLARAADRAGSVELKNLAADLSQLPHSILTDRAAMAERHRGNEELRNRLARLCETQPEVAAAIDAEIAAVNSDRDALDDLLNRQNYRLAYWGTAAEELSYRRFFNIETLVGLRAEDETVFADTHRLILQLVRDGTLDGLRIDHVDGLADPEGYLRRLRDATGGAYVVVEKILEDDEELPRSWPVAGTSGYDFLTRVSQLFVDPASEALMEAGYAGFTGERASYPEIVHEAKLQIMREELAAEIERLTGLLAEVCERHRRQRDHTRSELRDALREIIAAFAVYRTYARPGQPASAADRSHVAAAVAAARWRRPDLDAELAGFIGELVIGAHPGEAEAAFTIRFAQVSAPVMAKGVEDTAFYRYLPLVSLNEVGGDPGRFGRPVADFHQAMAAAARHWPEAMLTLSTHDTKRSGDVRARLSLLSEIPEAWELAVDRWSRHNERFKQNGWPDRNAEYLLYQTLVGAWPIDTPRVAAYMAKASKEAKVHTSWTEPSETYDRALESFVALDPRRPGLRRRPGGVPGRAPARGAGPDQLAGPDDAAADLPGRARPVPGHRGVGPVAGRPGQPQAGRLPARAAACWTRSSDAGPEAALERADAGRPEALADPPAAAAPPRPPGGLRAGFWLRAAAGGRAAGRARGGLHPQRRAGRGGAAAGGPAGRRGRRRPSTLPGGSWTDVLTGEPVTGGRRRA